VDRAIAGIAAAQYSVVTLAQLLSLGLSASAVRTRVAGGRLFRRHRGVFVVGRADLSLKGKWLAAVLACGKGALLSHISAAALHELLSARAGLPHVLVNRGGGRGHPGIKVHRSYLLEAADRTVIDGIPCTSVARTLLDIAATEPAWVLSKALNQAAIDRKLDVSDVQELLGRVGRHKGAARLRAAMGDKEIGADRTKSVLERRFLSLIRKAGLPYPAINEWMAIEGEEMQCDFVWHAQRVVVEVDGWETHQTKTAFEEDRRRDRILRLAGWTVLRFTWADVIDRPGEMASAVGELLAIAAD
jgi:very-short-patch-repair endonuclease